MSLLYSNDWAKEKDIMDISYLGSSTIGQKAEGSPATNRHCIHRSWRCVFNHAIICGKAIQNSDLRKTIKIVGSNMASFPKKALVPAENWKVIGLKWL